MHRGKITIVCVIFFKLYIIFCLSVSECFSAASAVNTLDNLAVSQANNADETSESMNNSVHQTSVPSSPSTKKSFFKKNVEDGMDR